MTEIQDRILVVDDDARSSADLAKTLNGAGYLDVDTASSAAEAFAKAESTRPNLVIIEVRSEATIDGVDAANYMRNEYHIPVIYTLSHSDREAVERAKVSEPHGMLVKPVNETGLQMTIDVALYRHMMDRDRRAWVDTTLAAIVDAVITVDLELKVTFLNATAEELTEWKNDEVKGKFVSEVLLIREEPAGAIVESPIKRALEDRTTIRIPSSILSSKYAREIPIEIKAAPIRTNTGAVSGGVLVFRDITEQKQAEQRLLHLARHDQLTGLANRSQFQDRLSQALALADRTECLASVILIDIDRFKTINETLGQNVGDLVIKAIAGRLENSVRKTDTVARWGDDEFAIVLQGITRTEDATTAAQKILSIMDTPLNVVDQEVFVTLSMGITVYPGDGRQIDDLMRNAHSAMYRAKNEGRNRFQFYDAEMNSTARRRLGLIDELHRAIENEEFELLYQPKLDLSTGTMESMEVLLRWRNPEEGVVSPAQFIPLAEETGLIAPIDEWVLRSACQHLHGLQNAGIDPFRVSVNLSAQRFRDKDLAATIDRILDDTQLSSKFLELELTEQLLMEDAQNTETMLNKLKTLGLTISVDNFGSGYSSFSHLERFPLDTLKIDQSLVRDITTSSHNCSVVSAIIELGHNLGLRVLAKGVETEDQLSFLLTHGCDLVQGFVYGRPVTPDTMSEAG